MVVLASSTLSSLADELLSHVDLSSKPSRDVLEREYNLTVKYNVPQDAQTVVRQLVPFATLFDFMRSQQLLPYLTATQGLSNGHVGSGNGHVGSGNGHVGSQSVPVVTKAKFVTTYGHVLLLFDDANVTRELRKMAKKKRQRGVPGFVAVVNLEKEKEKESNGKVEEEIVPSFHCHASSKTDSSLRVYTHMDLDVAELDVDINDLDSIFIRWRLPELANGFQSEDQDDAIVYGTVVCDEIDEDRWYDILVAIDHARGQTTWSSELYVQGLCSNDSASKLNIGRFGTVSDLWAKSFVVNNGRNLLWVVRTQGLLDPPLEVEGSTLSSFFKRHPCVICKITFMTAEDLVRHRNSVGHLQSFCAHQYNTSRSSFLAPKKDLEFQLLSNSPMLQWSGNVLVITCDDLLSEEVSVNLALVNKNKTEKVIVRQLHFLNPNSDFELSDTYGVTQDVHSRRTEVRNGVRLNLSSKLAFNLRVRRSNVGQTKVAIVAQIYTTQFEVMGMEVVVRTRTEEMKDLDAVSAFEKVKLQKSWRDEYSEIIPGRRLIFDQKATERRRELKYFDLPKDLTQLIDRNLEPKNDTTSTMKIQLDGLRRLVKELLHADNYRRKLRLSLQCEEQQMHTDIRLFDMEEVSMTKENDFLYLVVPGLSENRPSVLLGDRIDVRLSGAKRSKLYEGFVHGVESDRVKVGFGNRLLDVFTPGLKFNVQFHFNRHPMRLMHRAVEEIPDDVIAKRLFPSSHCQHKDERSAGVEFKAINRNVEGNAKQKQAVEAILAMGNDHPPYIIYGPPGTGKTVTVVEAMQQLYKRRDQPHILACAPSNSAADLLAKRLLSVVSNSELLRYYAKSRDPLAIPDELKKLSNLNRPNMGLKDILQYRVVVVTLCCAGALVTLGVPSNFFEYVFIDEAGQAMEPEAIIPVAHLLDTNKGKLVIVGDPKQLGPSIRSKLAKKGGLSKSLLERLMTTNHLYRPNSRSGEYDSRYVTKLLATYRAHESLLHIPSSLFYSNELKACADPAVTKICCNWSRLPNPGFPFIFHSVAGIDKREGKSPSFFNVEEVSVVVDYVVDVVKDFNKKGVKANDVGVITPYRRQVQKIREALRKKARKLRLQTLLQVEVGSVEVFQGQERKVIVISTVRSKEEFLPSDVEHKLGFVSHPKRFNVAITRARSLLIVVGNPIILKKCRYWRELINHAVRNRSYTGHVTYKDDHDQGELESITNALKELNFDEQKDFNTISEQELQEEPQWRADF